MWNVQDWTLCDKILPETLLEASKELIPVIFKHVDDVMFIYFVSHKKVHH